LTFELSGAKKTSDIFEIYGVSAWTGEGGQPVRTFYGRGEGQFFTILCERPYPCKKFSKRKIYEINRVCVICGSV